MENTECPRTVLTNGQYELHLEHLPSATPVQNVHSVKRQVNLKSGGRINTELLRGESNFRLVGTCHFGVKRGKYQWIPKNKAPKSLVYIPNINPKAKYKSESQGLSLETALLQIKKPLEAIRNN